MVIKFIESDNVFMLFPQTIKDQIDIGALCSRYSRSTLGARELYEKEFKHNKKRGVEFYDKVFVEYGDESVTDMVGGGITICFENITILQSTKLLHHRLLGAIEKSTRYVPLTIDNVEPEGKEQMQKFVDAFKKRNDELHVKYIDEHYYGNLTLLDKPTLNSIRSQALDETRHLIPLSAHTSLAITANIREWLHIIKNNDIPVLANVEHILKKYYPVFFKNIVYDRKEKIQFSSNGYRPMGPVLLETNVNSLRFYPRNKKQKLGREYEQYVFKFQISCNIGIFREIQRHRFLSIWDVVFYGNTLGDRCSFFMSCNLRELVHVVELRSQAPSHYEFRSLVLSVAKQVADHLKMDVKDIFKFITLDQDIKLGRLQAEQRTEQKKKMLGIL